MVRLGASASRAIATASRPRHQGRIAAQPVDPPRPSASPRCGAFITAPLTALGAKSRPRPSTRRAAFITAPPSRPSPPHVRHPPPRHTRLLHSPQPASPAASHGSVPATRQARRRACRRCVRRPAAPVRHSAL